MLSGAVRNELKALYFQAAANVNVVNVTALAQSFVHKRDLPEDMLREVMAVLMEAAESRNLPVELNGKEASADDKSPAE